MILQLNISLIAFPHSISNFHATTTLQLVMGIWLFLSSWKGITTPDAYLIKAGLTLGLGQKVQCIHSTSKPNVRWGNNNPFRMKEMQWLSLMSIFRVWHASKLKSIPSPVPSFRHFYLASCYANKGQGSTRQQRASGSFTNHKVLRLRGNHCNCRDPPIRESRLPTMK